MLRLVKSTDSEPYRIYASAYVRKFPDDDGIMYLQGYARVCSPHNKSWRNITFNKLYLAQHFDEDDVIEETEAMLMCDLDKRRIPYLYECNNTLVFSDPYGDERCFKNTSLVDESCNVYVYDD